MILKSAPDRVEVVRNVVVHDVPWDVYVRLVELPGAFHLRMTYDRGELEIMPPLPEHDWWKKIFATLIEDLVYEMRIHYQAYGSTTWKREDSGQGIEADECYYIQHARQVGFKRKFDLTVDPPPDLAVEIDVTSRSIAAETTDPLGFRDRFRKWVRTEVKPRDSKGPPQTS
jgi:Uma2 family endonuclease